MLTVLSGELKLTRGHYCFMCHDYSDLPVRADIFMHSSSLAAHQNSVLWVVFSPRYVYTRAPARTHAHIHIFIWRKRMREKAMKSYNIEDFLLKYDEFRQLVFTQQRNALICTIAIRFTMYFWLNNALRRNAVFLEWDILFKPSKPALLSPSLSRPTVIPFSFANKLSPVHLFTPPAQQPCKSVCGFVGGWQEWCLFSAS